jgi:acetyl esterase/lipase
LGLQTDPLFIAIAAAINDAAKGLAWMSDNAEQLGIDPERIVIGGGSSGGITSLLEGYGRNSTAAIVSLCAGMFGFETLIDASDPPVVLVHNTVDNLVPYSMAEAVVARAETVGVPNALLTFDGVGHCDFLTDPVQGPQTLSFINEFLYDQLELAAIPEPSTLCLAVAWLMAILTSWRPRR